MTDAEKKVLDEEVVVESVDVEVGTMEDVDAIMKSSTASPTPVYGRARPS